MGTLIQADLLSWRHLHAGPSMQKVLVTIHGSRYPGVCLRLYCLLQPLPIPRCPWSHIALDFIKGLLASNHNTVILTVIDRFSKFANFIPLPKLLSAWETAETLVQEVFRPHGIPQDIVFVGGSQFTSAVWKSFCSALGSSVSLSSGFQSQTNGQAERGNQVIEASLASSNSTTWSSQLQWAEYAHNTLPSLCLWLLATTLPLPGIRDLCPVCTTPPSALLQDLASGENSGKLPPYCCPGLRLWPEGKAVHSRLTHSNGLPQAFFQIYWPIRHNQGFEPRSSLSTATLDHVHSPHFSHLMHQTEMYSPLVPPVPPPPPPHMNDNVPAYTVCHLLDCRRRGAYSTWWTGRGKARRRVWSPGARS